jgi:hypothetical protein
VRRRACHEMDDPATEESDLPWEDDGDEQRNEEHRKDGMFVDPGIIFPFSPGTNVKGQIWGEGSMDGFTLRGYGPVYGSET